VWGTDLTTGEQTEPAAAGGCDEEGPALFPEAVRMLTSTNGGASWVELEGLPNLKGQLASPYLRASSGVSGAFTAGSIVGVLVETFVQLDFEQILTDNGVDPARFAGDRWGDGPNSPGQSDDGMSICLFPVGAAPEEGTDDYGRPVATDDEGRDGCAERLDVTFKQLGLSEADVAAIEMGSVSFELY
jgi:hypothetical protein